MLMTYKLQLNIPYSLMVQSYWWLKACHVVKIIWQLDSVLEMLLTCSPKLHNLSKFLTALALYGCTSFLQALSGVWPIPIVWSSCFSNKALVYRNQEKFNTRSKDDENTNNATTNRSRRGEWASGSSLNFTYCMHCAIPETCYTRWQVFSVVNLVLRELCRNENQEWLWGAGCKICKMAISALKQFTHGRMQWWDLTQMWERPSRTHAEERGDCTKIYVDRDIFWPV